ncbi:DUF3304 domain-containing protein [Pseudomonas sp. NPDC007930]|uniref:DUF3304 domain-containing protein n=1 Tax=Pseudomonas sp. NPDC007930 TaxID=3364417 RepID=UPI0036E59B08
MSALTRFGLGGAVLAWLLVGCSSPDDGWAAGDLKSVNHVKGTAINWFSVNGYRASGGGGNICCIALPNKWRPGMIADIKWEVDLDPYAYVNWPPLTSEGYMVEQRKHAKNYKHYEARVEIPEYDHDRCGMTVHFLTCQQVKVTTSCWATSMPQYPIQDPEDVEEPAVCPK